MAVCAIVVVWGGVVWIGVLEDSGVGKEQD